MSLRVAKDYGGFFDSLSIGFAEGIGPEILSDINKDLLSRNTGASG